MSTRPVTDAVLWPLESAYIPPAISSIKLQAIDQMVVLSGGGGLKTPRLNTLEGDPVQLGREVSGQRTVVRDPQITQKEKEQVSRKGAKSLRGKGTGAVRC